MSYWVHDLIKRMDEKNSKDFDVLVSCGMRERTLQEKEAIILFLFLPSSLNEQLRLRAACL
jgi:hypothetical protein